jgi:predicted ATPase
MNAQLIVITGSPGSGKSSLIQALAHQGVASMPEAGRAIIRDQMRIGGSALPWADRSAFAELMLSWELRSHGEARALERPVLMDRGIPDVLGYLRLCQLAVPEHMHRAAALYRYAPIVFLAPYWPEIYQKDAERKQDAQEAKATGVMMAEVYTELGYEVRELPRTSIEGRAAFLREHVSF